MSVIPLKYVARVKAGQAPPSAAVSDLADGLPFLQGNGEFQAVSPLPRLQCNTASKVAKRDDVLLSVRAPVGALNIADREYGIGRGLCALTATDCDGRFLWWWLHSVGRILDSVSTGTTYRAVTGEDVGMLPFPRIPLEEQRRIADFLDAETTRIDKLAELRAAVLDRLAEREAAEVDAALDELSDKFGYAPLRRFLLGVDQGSSPQCDAVPAADDEWGVLKVSCLRPGRFNPRENKRLPEGEVASVTHEVREGDLLVTRANTPQLVGSTAVVPRVRRRLLLSDKIFRIHLDDRFSPEFVAVVARGKRIRDICAAVSNGASQSMANIRFEEVKAWPLPLADLATQADVVARVTMQTRWVESIRQCVERQTKLLSERRQALITAAVTGEFDVSAASGRGIEE